ncbi:hypothetical protein CAPTEDRAFT_196025, partial [Capitella teleta]
MDIECTDRPLILQDVSARTLARIFELDPDSLVYLTSDANVAVVPRDDGSYSVIAGQHYKVSGTPLRAPAPAPAAAAEAATLASTFRKIQLMEWDGASMQKTRITWVMLHEGEYSFPVAAGKMAETLDSGDQLTIDDSKMNPLVDSPATTNGSHDSMGFISAN